jgi:hypothetical protein
MIATIWPDKLNEVLGMELFGHVLGHISISRVLPEHPERESIDARFLRLPRSGDVEDLDSVFVYEVPDPPDLRQSAVLSFSVPPS